LHNVTLTVGLYTAYL